jgi:hypothetical protein
MQNMQYGRMYFIKQCFGWRIGIILFLFAIFPISARAVTSNYREPTIHTYESNPISQIGEFRAFAEKFRGGLAIAAGDVDGDGVDEIIAGAGPGGSPQVRVFRADGTVRSQFFAYGDSFRGGVKVASCDFDGDGVEEVVTGAGPGGSPQVRIMTMWGESKFSPSFNAFERSFSGGVNVACGDVDGDGETEVVAGVGIGSEPKVRVFDRYGSSKDLDIVPYADRDKGGVAVAVANVDGGKRSEIVTAIYRFGRSLVKVYRANAARSIVAQFEGWPENVQGGFHVAAGDIDDDGYDEVVVSLASGGSPHVRAFEAHGKPLPVNFFAYEKSFRGGVTSSVGDIDGDGDAEILTAPGRNTIEGRTSYQKYIEVRLREQRLYAYENGVIEKTFLVSTGIAKYPTPEGSYTVTAKIFKKDYEWTYGENHPDNYDIKDVKWNLRFAPSYYLHYAFWHNNFGHRMSHGCVNINKENAEWIYQWADIGIPVLIRP